MNYLIVQDTADRVSDDYHVSLEHAEVETSSLEDEFFFERLKVFYEQSLTDIRAFAQREGRPYDQVRRRVSELHCKALFGAIDDEHPLIQDKHRASNILMSISSQLESLYPISGLQSFYLAVNPSDPSDGGFLGGTLLGREFWRDHRGGGAPGAKAFALFCQRALRTQSKAQTASTSHTSSSHGAGQTHPQNSSAKRSSEIKAEVYLAVRTAVRAASRSRQAEMKWSNHSNLATYGIELVGWPPGVPKRNPSALSAAQNQAILDALRTGRMCFRSLDTPPSEEGAEQKDVAPDVDEQAMFDEAIDFTAGESESGAAQHTGTIYDRGSMAYDPGKRPEQEREDRRGSPDLHLELGSSHKKRRREESEYEMTQSYGDVK